MKPLSQEALDQLFLRARTFNAWSNQPVSDDLLKELYELTKMGPTAANSGPMRIVFVKSKEAKEKLMTAMAPGNVEKTRQAPVTAIIAQDLEFHEKLPKLMPHTDARSWYAGNQPLIEETAFRSSSLQGAYLIMAARSLGLDCGPMSGFDANKLNELFFAGTSVKANFVCNLGYGDSSGQYPRLPRLNFDEAAKIV